MNLCINDFEGPIDLLLHLVKTAKMNIYDIDTEKIIEKYLEFINTLDKEDIDNASEYLVMAAELIHLKSRLLLNLEDDEEDNEYEINSEEDLKNKLIEYERYRNVTGLFKELEENRNEFFTKYPESLMDFYEKQPLEKGEVNADMLANALYELQKRMNYQKPLNTKITRKEIDIEDQKRYIRSVLEKRSIINFVDLFVDYSKEMVVATFLSILDMCKNKEIKLSQKENFDDILIEKV
ncbi:MAG: segregation/condensation protein A [Bacilli bacterium]